MDTNQKKNGYKKSIIIKTAIFSVALLLLFAVPVGYRSVKGDYDLNVEGSYVEAWYGKDFYGFETTEKTLIKAIEKHGIKTYDQDIFSIDKETELANQEYEVTITKSLPVVINDSGKKIDGRAAYSDPEKILDQNDVDYWPEDILSTELILDPINVGRAGRMVVVERAPVYTVRVDGTKKEIRSWNSEVSEIIKKAEIKLNPNDIISYPADSRVADGAEIVITRINHAEIVEVEEVPYRTVRRNDYYIPEGQTTISQPGVAGSKESRYKVTYRDGEEVSRTKIDSKVISNPKEKIIKRGLMPSGRTHFNRTYWNMMVTAGLRYGVSPLDLFTVAACESRVNPNSVSSYFSSSNRRYWGMYQYQSSGSKYSGGLFSSNASRLGFNPNAWNDAKAQINVTAFIVNNEGSWRRWGCKP